MWIFSNVTIFTATLASYMYINVYVYIYIYIYIYTYTQCIFIYIYIYICMYSPCSPLFVHYSYLPSFVRAQGISVLPPVHFFEWEE